MLFVLYKFSFLCVFFFFSSRRRHTRLTCDWSSDVCSSDLSRPVKALLTDLYELNMVASYLRRGMTGLATFSLFVRGLPKQRGFLVAAGIEGCLDYLQDLRFDEDEIRYLGDELKFPQGDLEAFRQFRFTGDVW